MTYIDEDSVDIVSGAGVVSQQERTREVAYYKASKGSD